MSRRSMCIIRLVNYQCACHKKCSRCTIGYEKNKKRGEAEESPECRCTIDHEKNSEAFLNKIHLKRSTIRTNFKKQFKAIIGQHIFRIAYISLCRR